MDWIIWMILWRYAAIPFIFTPLNAASLLLLPPDKVRMGSGLINILQQGVGSTVGLALMTTVLQRRTVQHTVWLDERQSLSSMSWVEVFEPLRDMVTQAGDVGSLVNAKAAALVHRYLLQHATVAAYQDCFLLLTAMALIVMPLMFFLRQRRAP